MHVYERTLVNINSLILCLVSINSSSDDLIESVYYISIPMQHLIVLRIFNSLYINVLSSSYVNYHAWRQRVVNFSIQLGSSTITPSRTARNLGVVIDDQLSFTDHIATTARSCRFALYNIRKIRPFLSEQAAQLLVQALVLARLDYCNALLAGLPACTIKPLQLIQNAAARVVFNEPKKAHVTPLFIRLHLLPIAARIKFKVLMFAYKTTTGKTR